MVNECLKYKHQQCGGRGYLEGIGKLAFVEYFEVLPLLICTLTEKNKT